MGSAESDREALEELWRQRVKDAKLRVDFARIYREEIARDFPAKERNADGHFAHQRALTAENLALEEYDRILRIYTNLIVNGILPDPNEWRKARDTNASDSESNS